ncbi:MAG: hypothetical protein M1821_005528 [Bathelium mastoideum]|nr:MAG: hypothetical protein M1821_005528 [Bathelium mastoideum]
MAAATLGERLHPVRSHPYETDTQAHIEQRYAAAILEPETDPARIERLGRQRPEKFPTVWKEAGFCFSVVMSQAITEYFVSGYNVINPPIAKDLDIPFSATVWPASSFSLVLSAFLLPFGRVADIWGAFPIYVAGTAWTGIWSAIAGAAQSGLMLDLCRAFQGLGPAAFLPASLMLLGSIYRPGPRKNLIFCIYGAMAPLGFYLGILFAGIAGSFANWRWYFFVGAILACITAVLAYATIPSDTKERRAMGVKMDWWGSMTIVCGLILTIYALTDVSRALHGWRTPYIIVTFVLGLLFLMATVYVEGWVADTPLLPADLFRVPCMKPLMLALIFFYGCMGVYLLYASYYLQNIMGASPIKVAAWCTPMALGGIIISTVGGFVLHLIPGRLLLLVSCVGWILAPLLLALAPEGANYWAWVLPSMTCSTIGIDIMFNATNVFITTSLPLRRQGLAGALINLLTQLGIAFCLSLADMMATAAKDQGPKKSYQNAFWFQVACASFSFVLLMGFVKIERAKSDLTADEKEASDSSRSGSESSVATKNIETLQPKI